MSEDDPMRKIELKTRDALGFLLTGNDRFLQEEIAESAVQEFCDGCDLLQKSEDDLEKNRVCLLGSNKQARYAARGSCGWAQVDGKRGQMTDEGFVIFKSGKDSAEFK